MFNKISHEKEKRGSLGVSIRAREASQIQMGAYHLWGRRQLEGLVLDYCWMRSQMRHWPGINH